MTPPITERVTTRLTEFGLTAAAREWVREGHRLKVYLSRDLSLPSSEQVQPSSLPEVP